MIIIVCMLFLVLVAIHGSAMFTLEYWKILILNYSVNVGNFEAHKTMSAFYKLYNRERVHKSNGIFRQKWHLENSFLLLPYCKKLHLVWNIMIPVLSTHEYFIWRCLWNPKTHHHRNTNCRNLDIPRVFEIREKFMYF